MCQDKTKTARRSKTIPSYSDLNYTSRQIINLFCTLLHGNDCWREMIKTRWYGNHLLYLQVDLLNEPFYVSLANEVTKFWILQLFYFFLHDIYFGGKFQFFWGKLNGAVHKWRHACFSSSLFFWWGGVIQKLFRIT